MKRGDIVVIVSGYGAKCNGARAVVQAVLPSGALRIMFMDDRTWVVRRGSTGSCMPDEVRRWVPILDEALQ